MGLPSLTVLSTLGRCAEAACWMFWETLWALVAGFCISGVVQTFVPTASMRRQFGDHRPRTLARAAGYGMASSSCSYAAAAMTRSLLSRGADEVTALAFMVASTNLVVELGLVLLALLGWQFVVAQLAGGAGMIVVLGVVGAAFLAAPSAGRALRGRVRRDESRGVEEPADTTSVHSRHGWDEAAARAVADATMLRRELVVGFAVAGVLSVAVPTSWWGTVLLRGPSPWVAIENALVAPLVAMVSCVCSVGNVPLAAALWSRGVPFTGVVAFLLADLLALPLVLIYRKYFGAQRTTRIVALLYVAIVVSSLFIAGVCEALGLVPPARPAVSTSMRFTWDATTVLNIGAILLAAVAYAASRRSRIAPVSAGSATDPVCGMPLRISEAPAHDVIAGEDVWFCSERCRSRFVGDVVPDG